MKNLNNSIELLADSLVDCIVFAKEGKKVSIVEYKKVERKFKPRKVSKKRVYGF